MISLINITIFILWFLSAFADYTDHTFIFQLKEYRWDRFRDFLSTKQGKNYLLRYNFFWRSLFVILILFWPINEIIYVKYVLIAIFVIAAVITPSADMITQTALAVPMYILYELGILFCR